MQGPDMINKLLPVLLRFRQHSIAVQADIEAMYNQVRIPARDRDALRFLWYINGKLRYLRMTSHLFGGVWCAASSAYALRRTITDLPSVIPLVKYAVERSFYVDDCLSSVSSKSDAEIIIREIPKALKSGGFKLTKFVVNDFRLLAEVSVECRAKEVLDFGTSSESRALGIKWMVSRDEFFFALEKDFGGLLTRRRMLSIVSSIFDPLGLISPVVLSGKLLFQEATARGLSWDEEIPPDIVRAWDTWAQSLSSVSRLRVPRCIKPCSFDDAFIELHHFSDASSKGYGCCCYVRCVNRKGEIHVQLVMSKSKVAPLKLRTIPRLELQAAVLAVKVDSLLRRELALEFAKSYFWTDSEVVLKYIHNDSRRFHVFVGNRVSLIREFSDPQQWFHIETKANPADLVTRNCSFSKFNSSKWFNGPDKLGRYKNDWQTAKLNSLVLTDDDPEVKETDVTVGYTTVAGHVSPPGLSDAGDSDEPLYRIMNHYSSWFKMKRGLAWLLRLVRFFKGQKPLGRLSVQEVRRAGDILLRKSQSSSFCSELERLSQGKAVRASSSLKTLTPFLDGKGLLRVGGRLKEFDSKHPCIISGKHPIAESIVKDAHSIAHVGIEWVLSIVRKDFWVTKGRPLVKRIVRACVTCRRLYSKPCVQQMANLPRERIAANVPPFIHVGIDVFGPYYVKFGRSEVKRYGCLFTCLTVRAVHIEKLDSLDTESFLNGFRRFVARRGCPETVFSDNGTNFVGGEAELRRGMRDLSNKVIHAYAVKENFDWHFIPPTASHMGGAWERMVGVIKRVMSAILPSTVRLTDEILGTLFCEVESIVNGRPLTKLSDDPRDPTPLTPNHLLLLRHGPRIPPGKFENVDRFRRRWRHVQHLANQFWRKWLKLYLPELQKRSKWTGVTDNLAVGDLVLILDELTPRNLWPLALVVSVNCSRDGLVRSVRVKTRTTELVRPITKIVLLESALSSS
ncbi:uncharacterized protein [Apostichopus japonicus]|uniref:uncharacterized protein n=1 Tax=Stichopus japonicus TaxID=307972 RepID=UPI003AB5F303